MKEELKPIDPELREIVLLHEPKIKETIFVRFQVPADALCLLIDYESGVYLSEKEPETLCCLVLGKNNGHLYLVTAKKGESKEDLSDFRSALIS